MQGWLAGSTRRCTADHRDFTGGGRARASRPADAESCSAANGRSHRLAAGRDLTGVRGIRNTVGGPIQHERQLIPGKNRGRFARCKLILPGNVSMLIKCLILLEGTSRLLNPKFNLAELLEPWRQRLTREQFSPMPQIKGISADHTPTAVAGGNRPPPHRANGAGKALDPPGTPASQVRRQPASGWIFYECGCTGGVVNPPLPHSGQPLLTGAVGRWNGWLCDFRFHLDYVLDQPRSAGRPRQS